MPGPALNDPAAPSRVQAPRLTAHVNGQVVDGLAEASVERNGFYQAGTWSLTVYVVPGSPQTLAWWDGQPSRPLVDIYAQQDAASPPVLWISGKVDSIEIDVEDGRVTLAGRDRAGEMIDLQTDGPSLQNRTSSEVAAMLAGQAGLTPVVTATSTPIGRFDRINHLQGVLAIHDRRGSAHALLSELAKLEGFDFFVYGNELHFQPPPSLDSAPTWLLRYAPGPSRGNWEPGTLHLHHDLQVAKAITVVVLSWQPRSEKVIYGIKSDVPVTVSKSGINAGTPTAHGSTKYSYSQAGLTQQAADNLALQQYNLVKRHTLSLRVTLRDAFALTPQHTITLQGSGTGFDLTYYVKTISASMSAEDCSFEVSGTTIGPVLQDAGSTGS